MSQYDGDATPIVASPGTPFSLSLGCSVNATDCSGTAEQWVQANFVDWDVDNVPYDLLYFIGVIMVTRIVTFWALRNLDFRAN